MALWLYTKLLLSQKHRQQGQVFLEFVLLMVAIIILSFTTLHLVNGRIGTIWQYMVNVVVGPEAQVQLR